LTNKLVIIKKLIKMKKLSKLKLNQLSKTELEKREMNMLNGGTCACTGAGTPCSCAYEGPQCSSNDSYYGGSSNAQNANANDPGTTNANSNTK
jgi:natural product precursor